MILRRVCLFICLCLTLGPTVESQVTVDEQGYQNILITFASNVPSKDGQKIVENIQELLRNTSSVLNKAIGIPIASVTFLLPSSWSTKTWNNIAISPASSEQAEGKPDIRVDAGERSPFGKQPAALQYGGCGVPGHQITLPIDFLKNNEKYPKGRVLAREWLKYRYGVFNENGYPEDIYYPEYHRIPGGSYTYPRTDIKIPDCTNLDVAYTFRRPVFGDKWPCNMDSAKGGFGTCKAYPVEKSAIKINSSLMYFHNDLPNMELICGKDGIPHHSTARNKHNALCNGRSIWDVIKSSADFKTTPPQPVETNTTLEEHTLKFTYIQKKPTSRFVVLLENSDKLHEKDVPSAIKFALRRFYYDLFSKSKLAMYTYNTEVTEALPYTELPDFGRKDLGNFVDFGSPATSICTSCGLAKAVDILLQNNEKENGSILLITASPLDKVPQLSEKLKESGICLHVLRFTDKNNPADQSYDPLANLFACFSQESLQMSLDVVDIFNNVFRFLTNDMPELGDNVEFKTVASGNLSAQTPVTISPDSTAEIYTVWLGRALQTTSVECKAGDTVIELKPDKTATDIASFTFFPEKNDEVTCKLGSTKQSPALTQVTMLTVKGHYFDFDTWIHDVSTKEKQLPIIVYAKLFSQGYPIKYANVTMVVKSEKNPDEVVKMVDNGQGDPDVTQYDGIYSAYFSNFLNAGKYLISVTIDDNNGEARIGKGTLVSTAVTCCGSKVVSVDFKLAVPAFKKEKQFVYEAENKRPKDGYPPAKVLNLVVVAFPSEKAILISPIPGGEKATRFDVKLFRYREDAVSNFDNTGIVLNTSSLVSNEKEIRLTVPYDDLQKEKIYYAAIRSWNEFNKSSEISNVAEFIVPGGTIPENESTSTPTSTTGDGRTEQDPPKSKNKTLGIVLGVLGGIVVLCALAFLGYYFFVKKPRRN